MSAISESGDRYHRISTVLAHYQAPTFIGALTVDVALALTHQTRTPAGYVIGFIALLAVMATMLAELRHSRSLCERCAAKTPLDPQAAVQRRARWLRLFHLINSVPALTALVVLYVGGILVLPADFSAYLAEAPLYLFWAVAAAANLIHRPLEPWCPRCNWGDGGDEEDVPAPPPVPVATNTR